VAAGEVGVDHVPHDQRRDDLEDGRGEHQDADRGQPQAIGADDLAEVVRQGC
jgi:hypothetical protein